MVGNFLGKNEKKKKLRLKSNAVIANCKATEMSPGAISRYNHRMLDHQSFDTSKRIIPLRNHISPDTQSIDKKSQASSKPILNI